MQKQIEELKKRLADRDEQNYNLAKEYFYLKSNIEDRQKKYGDQIREFNEENQRLEGELVRREKEIRENEINNDKDLDKKTKTIEFKMTNKVK